MSTGSRRWRHASSVAIAAVAVASSACTSIAVPPSTAQRGVIYTFPVDGQLDVPLGAPVVVTFSDPIDASALGPCTQSAGQVVGALCVVGPDGPIDATPALTSIRTTVQLTGALAPATTYSVYVAAQLAPTATNLPASGPLFRFTTRSTAPRAAAPELIAVNGGPPSAPDAVLPMSESSTIQLVFSEPLDPRTVALAAGAIELRDATSGQAVPATLVAEGIHVSIDPVADLTAEAPYQLKVGAAVTDLAGQPVTPTAVTLTPQRTRTGPAIAEALRTRLAGDPGAAVLYAGADRNVIAIDHPLIGHATSTLAASVLAAELGDPTALGGPIAFTIRRGQRLRAQGLTVALGGELPAGLSTGDLVIELLTDATGRIARNPHQPAAQRPDNERAVLVTALSMDLAVYAVDPTGNAVLSQTVLGVQGSGVVTAADGVLDIQAVIAIDLNLLGVATAPASLVLELITAPGAAAQDDPSPPALVASLPGGGGELAVDGGVELIFTEPIDLDRARAGGIALETQAGQAVASVVESHGAAVVVRPLAPLLYSTSYRVALADVADVAGHPLAPTPPLAFSTPVLAATTAPLTVAAVHPGAACALTGVTGVTGATGATATSPGHCVGGAAGDDAYQPFSLAANEPVEVRFTQPVAPASITLGACNAGSARIEQLDAAGACVAPVAGTWSQHDRTLSFVPDVAWQVGQRYRLTLVSGADRSCTAGEICGLTGVAASFDPLGGNLNAAAGGPDLVIDFAGAAASAATALVTQAAPFTDQNGSGFVEAGEVGRDDNRAALRITGTTGIVTDASFDMADCLPATAEVEACMYLAGALPVELLPLAHNCALPGGGVAASCVPVALTPQTMYGTSLTLDATAMLDMSTVQIHTATGMFVLRIREPASGPVTGYIIDDDGTPTLTVALDLYLDAPDMQLPLLDHDVHSKPVSVALRGPLTFLADGRIAIAVTNTADVAVAVDVTGEDHGQQVSGSVKMAIPSGEMKLQLVSPPVRGGLP